MDLEVNTVATADTDTTLVDTQAVEWAYINGQYMPLAEATVPVLDRGFLFGDAVYEVIPVHRGRVRSLDKHLERLESSLQALRIDCAISDRTWETTLNKLISLSQHEHQYIYIQITRGVAHNRNHPFPNMPVKPTVVLFTQVFNPVTKDTLSKGLTAITLTDTRWAYPYIKTTNLLANVLLRQEGLDKGADEVILLREGHISEATACNVFIVKDNTLFTPPSTPQILSGVTRSMVLDIAKTQKIPCKEQAISENQLRQADEIWITNSTRGPNPITRLNDKPVGSGQAGPIWHIMYDSYQQLLG